MVEGAAKKMKKKLTSKLMLKIVSMVVCFFVLAGYH